MTFWWFQILPISNAADTAVTEYWFSICFGKNTANPEMISPSDAPARFRNRKVGFLVSDMNAFGISLNFVNACDFCLSPLCASEIFCSFSEPGNVFGKAMSGITTSRQTKEKITNPIHQAPTHTLFSGVKPSLWMKKRFENVHCHVAAQTLTLRDPLKRNRCTEAEAASPERSRTPVR